MALSKRVVDIRFNKGVDTGRDPKLVIPSKFTRLDNLEVDRLDTLRQRPGYTAATITPFGSAGIGTILNIKQLHVLGASVIMEAANGFFEFVQNRSSARDKLDAFAALRTFERGHVDFADVASSAHDQYGLDAAAASPSALECWAWTESDGNVGNLIKFRIIDGPTRAVLQEGVVDGAAVNTTNAFTPRVMVRNLGGASRFYIYYLLYTTAGTVTELRMKSIDVAAGDKVHGALSSSSLLATTTTAELSTVGFDAWYDSTGDKILLVYPTPTLNNFNLDIINGSNGTTVSATSTKVAAATFATLSVTAVYNGATGYALVCYDGATALINAYSTKFDGTTALNSVLTAGATTDGALVANGRIAVMASPFTAGKALVFFDTSNTAAATFFFPTNVGYVGCDYNGANPTTQSVFVRGLALAARPAAYLSGAATEVCVTAALLSSLQPTIFMLKFGGSGRVTTGFGVAAAAPAGTHTPPRVLARLLPGECGSLVTRRSSSLRLPSPLAVV